MLFGILLVTGIYLMFVYTPSVGSAYGDMQNLKTGVGFGQLIRNVHRWSAHLMVLVVALHLVRVFYAGAYKKPREFNWVIGVMLLLLTLGFSFTGYLLPWDQLAYWAVTVGTNLVHYVPLVGGQLQDLLIGGPQVGQNTLLRFYALHVAVLPLLLALMLTVHIWRVRKDGFAVERTSVGAFAEEATERPGGAAHRRRRRWRRLRPSSTAVACGCSASSTASRSPRRRDRSTTPSSPGRICSCDTSSSRSAPPRSCSDSASRSAHHCAASPTRTSHRNRPRRRGTSPGLQELLSRFDPLVAGILVPAGAVLVLVLLPYIDRNPDTRASHRKVAITLFSALLAIAVILTVIGTFFRGPGWQFIAPWTHSYIEL